jgi:hypothetical protein
LNKEQIDALIALIEAIIDDKISDAFNRDSLSEMIERRAAETAFRELVQTEETK